MSKTRTASAAPPFSARRRRRRLSSRPGFSRQPALSSFFLAAGGPGLEERSAAARASSERKNHCGLPRGFPHRSVAIRLKVARLFGAGEKIKRPLEPPDFAAAPFATRRAASLWAAAPRVNRHSDLLSAPLSWDIEDQEDGVRRERRRLQSSACRRRRLFRGFRGRRKG